ncbi:MAG: alpha/beta fold hydrolase [Pseudomonadota bacterium]
MRKVNILPIKREDFFITANTFTPSPIFSHGLIQTLLPSFIRQKRYGFDDPIKVKLHDGDEILLMKNRPSTPPKGKILLIPGLGTSALSVGPSRIARKLNDLGYITYRFNHRGLGQGQTLAKGTYHAGRSLDAEASLAAVDTDEGELPIIAIGFSLGGNLLLRHAGRAAVQLENPLPRSLKGIVALSPIVELEECTKALAKAGFGLIDRKFVQHALSYAQRRHKNWPELGPLDLPTKFSLYQFDDLYTAKQNGFSGALEYYQFATAKTWLHHIHVPTHVLMAQNDPLVIPDHISYPSNIKATITKSGGHLGFISKTKTPFDDYFWMDHFIVTRVNSLLSVE